MSAAMSRHAPRSPLRRPTSGVALALGLLCHFGPGAIAAQTTRPYPEPPAGAPPAVANPDAVAETAASMRPYEERIPGTDVRFRMVPVPGGAFQMGSPEDEAGRKSDEGPRHPVRVSAFWIGVHEVTWDEYHVFMLQLDVARRTAAEDLPQDAWADAVSRPTPPYAPMDFGMGVEGYPAVCMTQFAARQYTRWLSMKTGRVYRLPTEAEWEYACRAGTDTRYSFGADPSELEDHAWFAGNSDDAYHPVGRKTPNPWGLHDMHGNVAEWVLDRHDRDFYGLPDARLDDPVAWPAKLYPRVVRGGSWDDDAPELRSAARRGSHKRWKMQDPQLPKSIWYHTDAPFVGFRVVRPLVPPGPEDRERAWDPDVKSVRRVWERQRAGER